MKSSCGHIASSFWLTVFCIGIFVLPAGLIQAQNRSRVQAVEAFFTAIQMNDTNTAATLLESNTNLARAGENFSKLPLLEAAAAGNAPLVKRLLQLGADINAAGDTRSSGGSQMTALHEAIEHNQPAVCQLLLAAGADPNVMAFGFTTPLHLAFSEHRETMAGRLLDYGAEPFQGKLFSNDETTPFELDIIRSDGRLVARMLGQHPKQPLGTKSLQKPRSSKRPRRGMKTSAEVLSQHGDELLTAAARRGELEAVQALLKAGVSAQAGNTNCPTLLQTFALAAATAAENRPAVVGQLRQLQNQLQQFGTNVASGFAASVRTETAELTAKLAATAPERWQKILDVLIQNGADYDAFAATALNDTNQTQRLVSADKNVAASRDCQAQTPLGWAIQTDRPQMVSFWIHAGTPLSATNNSGQTALHLAATAGKTDFVKQLLAAQAPTNLRDTNGWTPLDAAIQAKQSDCIHLLLTGKATSAHPERGLAITLHDAATTGNLAALAALLETETNLEARNELGLTPLQLAVTKGHLAAAALLLDKGADLNVRDPAGNSLLHQIFLQDRFTVYDRPPTHWLTALKDRPHKVEYIKYLTVGPYEQGPNPVLQGTSFLLACGLDAKTTNNAGQTVMQLVTDEKISRSVFFFDDDQEKLIKLLSGAGGNVDQRDAEGNTALHRLVASAPDANGVDRMKSLIAAGADVNATNQLGQTPLHMVAEKIWGWDMNEDGDNEPFQLLVKSGANVNAQDNQGRTPLDVLMAADTSFKRAATELLVKAGAKSNDPDKQGMTPLHLLAASGEAFTSSAVQSLLDSGASPNARDEHGRTPAHLFLTGKWPWNSAGENLQLLAKAGADFSIKDNQGRTPLHYFASLGSERPTFFIRGLTDLFVAAKVDFNARDNDGNTPLHIAAQTGTRDVFDWLVKQGADLEATNNAGETPRLLAAHGSNDFRQSSRLNADTDIFTAAREGKLEPLAALIKADPSLANATNRFGQSPLRVAVLAHRPNAVEFLNHHGTRWDIVSAVLSGQTNALLEILARQPDELAAKNYGSSLLHLAAANGDVETTKILLNAGGDLRAQDHRGLSPLGVARLQHQAAVVEILLQHGATGNIFDAAYNGRRENAALLIARDKSLALATNFSGVSVLEIATGTGHADLLQLLLEHGASAKSVRARSGRTPLHFAAIYNQTNTARLLIRQGASVEAYDQQGFTPLHIAAVCGVTEVVALLIKNNADPNQLTTESSADPRSRMPMIGGQSPLILPGDSALHLAAVFGQTNIIQLLLASGARVNALDARGRTALDLAIQAGFPPAMFMIQRQLGSMNPLGISEPPPFAGLQTLRKHQKVTASLLEKAGGQRGKSSGVNQGFGGPPGFPQ